MSARGEGLGTSSFVFEHASYVGHMHGVLSFQEYVGTFIPQSILLSLSFGFSLCLLFPPTDIHCLRWKMLVHLPLKFFLINAAFCALTFVP